MSEQRERRRGNIDEEENERRDQGIPSHSPPANRREEPALHEEREDQEAEETSIQGLDDEEAEDEEEAGIDEKLV
jgi:hypothetical protein